ncbi:Uncharacterised protein [Vibrio cholerae]|nr:Uncharacterised protein [Vibrio cholerae]CSI67303.1 Uncharacterised protein [Vibrio cholerae]
MWTSKVSRENLLFAIAFHRGDNDDTAGKFQGGFKGFG